MQRIDDLDHRLLAGDGRSITFSLHNVTYEIDLCPENAQKLTDALAPFVAAARKVPRR